MSGCRGRVQAIIQQKLGRVIRYLHCFNHRLHLVIVDCILSIADLTKYFDYCKTLYYFLRQPKFLALYSLIEHRWSGYLKTTLLIVRNYCEIFCVLHSIVKSTII